MTFNRKIWGAIIGGLFVFLAVWLGVEEALLITAGAIAGFLVGAVLEGDITVRESGRGRLRRIS